MSLEICNDCFKVSTVDLVFGATNIRNENIPILPGTLMLLAEEMWLGTTCIEYCQT